MIWSILGIFLFCCVLGALIWINFDSKDSKNSLPEEKSGKNWCYRVPDGPHAGEVLWSGCYCGTCAIVITEKDGEHYILANQRGKGTPDFKGYWNLPCGFMEPDENGKQCAARETYEECGVKIPWDCFELHNVETEPEKRHKGHVTLRYIVIIGDLLRDKINLEDFDKIGQTGGEKDEVEARKWINIRDFDNYKWAFNHREIIQNLIKTYDLI